MSHLDYYKYQAIARGVTTREDVLRQARAHAYLYDQMLASWMPQDKRAAWLDIACGHGSFLVYLRERGYDGVQGVDSSLEQVTLARSAGLSVHQADAIQWLEEQPRGRWQVMSAIDFIEHISKDEMMRFLTAAHGALAPGGRLILRYPNADSPLVGLNLFNDITHVWTYTSNCLNTLAQMHGFKHSKFTDEGVQAVRDHRWLKVPVGKAAGWVLGMLFQAASRERVRFWGSSMWACLEN